MARTTSRLLKIVRHKRNYACKTLAFKFAQILCEGLFEESWSPSRMEYLFTNVIAALSDTEGTTLLGVSRMLSEKDYQQEVKHQLLRAGANNEVIRFWFQEYPNWTETQRREATPPILNKVCQLFLNPLLQNMLGQRASSLDLATIMREGGILIVNLAEGRAGDRAADLMGSLLLHRLYQEAMERMDDPEAAPFNVYVDEFPFLKASRALGKMFSGARKAKLNLTLSHQYVDQMQPPDVRAAVFGSVGTLLSFRVSEYDAERYLEGAMPHPSKDERLADLDNYELRVKTLQLEHDEAGTPRVRMQPPLTIRTLPLDAPSYGLREEIIGMSQTSYGRPREEVEREIQESWYPYIEKFVMQFD